LALGSVRSQSGSTYRRCRLARRSIYCRAVSFLSTFALAALFKHSKAEVDALRHRINAVLFEHYWVTVDGRTEWREGYDPNASLAPTAIFFALRAALSAFWHAFQVDCRDFQAYSVQDIPGLNVSDLLTRARVRIHESVRSSVPVDALEEMDLAGRCWAYECHTATGFHALRAIEVVIEHYVRACGGTKPEYKSWHDFIDALEKLENGAGKVKPSKKVKARLKDLKDLDRNPLMHPRESLDAKGADRLFDLAKITITDMVEDLRARGLQIVKNDGEQGPPHLDG
jgi:hypothetical protein